MLRLLKRPVNSAPLISQSQSRLLRGTSQGFVARHTSEAKSRWWACRVWENIYKLWGSPSQAFWKIEGSPTWKRCGCCGVPRKGRQTALPSLDTLIPSSRKKNLSNYQLAKVSHFFKEKSEGCLKPIFNRVLFVGSRNWGFNSWSATRNNIMMVLVCFGLQFERCRSCWTLEKAKKSMMDACVKLFLLSLELFWSTLGCLLFCELFCKKWGVALCCAVSCVCVCFLFYPLPPFFIYFCSLCVLGWIHVIFPKLRLRVYSKTFHFWIWTLSRKSNRHVRFSAHFVLYFFLHFVTPICLIHSAGCLTLLTFYILCFHSSRVCNFHFLLLCCFYQRLGRHAKHRAFLNNFSPTNSPRWPYMDEPHGIECGVYGRGVLLWFPPGTWYLRPLPLTARVFFYIFFPTSRLDWKPDTWTTCLFPVHGCSWWPDTGYPIKIAVVRRNFRYFV